MVPKRVCEHFEEHFVGMVDKGDPCVVVPSERSFVWGRQHFGCCALTLLRHLCLPLHCTNGLSGSAVGEPGRRDSPIRPGVSPVLPPSHFKLSESLSSCRWSLVVRLKSTRTQAFRRPIPLCGCEHHRFTCRRNVFVQVMTPVHPRYFVTTLPASCLPPSSTCIGVHLNAHSSRIA